MSACRTLGGDGVTGIADALRTIDCRTSETTAYAFGRLFGVDGRLLPALTILLTLYVAFFAISLLTGRSRIGISALTPRTMTRGLVLTFATSWAAYQNVIWTVATGVPDQIAGVLSGKSGSATHAFAVRLDHLVQSLADLAEQASAPAPTAETAVAPVPASIAGFSASTILSASALVLLLGTVGVLVTAKIALAALLAVGPLFIVLALFRGTHGLFEGWLKATILFALVPLFDVLLGSGVVGALTPVVRILVSAGSQPEPRTVALLFLGSIIYCALMVLAVKAATTIVGGWRIAGGRESAARNSIVSRDVGANSFVSVAASGTGANAPADDRVRRLVAAFSAHERDDGSPRATLIPIRTPIMHAVGASGHVVPLSLIDHRIRGVGSRFRDRPAAISKGHLT